MNMNMKRDGLALKNQATTYIKNIGAAESLSYITIIDPAFKKFLAEECGVNMTKIEQIGSLAHEVAGELKNGNIVTEENCERWLKENDLYTDEWSRK